MKKLIVSTLLSTSLFTTQVMAEMSDLYVGFDVVGSSNTIEHSIGSLSDKYDDDSDGFKIKFGADLDSGWRLQGYFQHETYDKIIFPGADDELNEIGLDVIKGFEVTPEFSPFIQAGIGYGWMEVDKNIYTEDTIAAVSLKIGAGLMYKFTPIFEGLVGVDLQYRKWQDIDILGLGITTVETEEGSTKFYVGANIHF